MNDAYASFIARGDGSSVFNKRWRFLLRPLDSPMTKIFIQGVCILGTPISRTSNKDILLNNVDYVKSP